LHRPVESAGPDRLFIEANRQAARDPLPTVDITGRATGTQRDRTFDAGGTTRRSTFGTDDPPRPSNAAVR